MLKTGLQFSVPEGQQFRGVVRRRQEPRPNHGGVLGGLPLKHSAAGPLFPDFYEIVGGDHPTGSRRVRQTGDARSASTDGNPTRWSGTSVTALVSTLPGEAVSQQPPRATLFIVPERFCESSGREQ